MHVFEEFYWVEASVISDVGSVCAKFVANQRFQDTSEYDWLIVVSSSQPGISLPLVSLGIHMMELMTCILM
jgi:hypothetical protein